MNTMDNEKTTNLSIEHNLIKEPHGLDSIPGYVVVVFKRLANGGMRFFKIVNQNERFKRFLPIWNSPQDYFAIAVNQSVLTYTFASPVTLDDAIHQFTLIFHLTCRAVDPRLLAQLHAQDPLNLLRKMIIEAISRSCKPRKWDMVKERFRELERLLLDSERGKIIQYAETLGIEVISLDLDKQLRSDDIKTDLKEVEAEERKRGLRIEHYVKLTEHELSKAKELEFAKNSAYVEKKRFELENEVSKTNEHSGGDAETKAIQDENAPGDEEALLGQPEDPQPQFADEATDEKQQSLTQQIWAHDTANLIKRLIAVGADPEAAAKAREALQKIGTEFFQTAVPGFGSSSSEDSTNNQRTETVACTVFAPPRVRRGSNILVQVFAHLEKDQVVVKRLASEFDEETRRVAFKRLNAEIERPSKLGFCISMRGVRIDEPIQELIWRGQPEVVQFGVHIPEDITENEIVGTIYVTQNTVPFGHLKFLLCIEDVDKGLTPGKQQSEILNTWKRYDYAFISYASQDRSEVLKRVQMLERLHIRYFQDLLTLEPGDRWNEEIYKNIDRSDVFFLFWSSAARDSKWVMKEVRYALKKKGADRFAAPEIVPIIIEGPPPVPAPDELRDIYFNDVFIYFIN